MANIQLVDLVRKYVPGLRREGATVWSGACPLCTKGALTGNDRLRVKPDLGLWTCQKCQIDPSTNKLRWDDMVGFLKKVKDITYTEACMELDIDPENYTKETSEKEFSPPDATWLQEIEAFIKISKDRLWSAEGLAARRFLDKNRCLDDDYIYQASLGLNPSIYRMECPDEYGEPPVIPSGLVIPLIGMDGNTWGLKIYTGKNSKNGRKYHLVSGSKPVLQGYNSSNRILILCEGELDHWVARQYADDLLDIGTLGSASCGLSDYWLRYLLSRKCIIPLYDNDMAGQSGWRSHLGWLKGKLLTPAPKLPGPGKDITDFVVAGGDFRLFIEELLLPVVNRKIGGADDMSASMVKLNIPARRVRNDPSVETIIENSPQPLSLAQLIAALPEYTQESVAESLDLLVATGTIMSRLDATSGARLYAVHVLAEKFDMSPAVLNYTPLPVPKPYYPCAQCGIIDWISAPNTGDCWCCAACRTPAPPPPENILPEGILKRKRPVFGTGTK